MAKKSVYASIEIADREVRLAVVEIFNNRSNVLRVERCAHSGISNGKITDEKEVTNAVKQALSQAENALGYRIERVLLAVPSRGVKNVNTKVHIDIDDGTHTVRRFHLQQGLKTAMHAASFDDEVLINVNRIQYFIGATHLDEMPFGCDAAEFDMDVDLLYENRELVFSYVKAVEDAGIQVMDIAVDLYAAAKETGSLLQSADAPVILISLEADHTALALLNQNKIAFCAVIDQGYQSFIEKLQDRYQLSDSAAWRLLENLFSVPKEDDEDRVIYIEQQENRRVEITRKELADAVLPRMRSWIAEINAACQAIVSQTKARYLITGQGSNIPVLRDLLKDFNASADVYSVSSIGARSGCFVVPLGMAYVWEDGNEIQGRDKISVNNNELEESIESITRYVKDEEGGFTRKLKRVILTSKN